MLSIDSALPSCWCFVRYLNSTFRSAHVCGPCCCRDYDFNHCTLILLSLPQICQNISRQNNATQPKKAKKEWLTMKALALSQIQGTCLVIHPQSMTILGTEIISNARTPVVPFPESLLTVIPLVLSSDQSLLSFQQKSIT